MRKIKNKSSSIQQVFMLFLGALSSGWLLLILLQSNEPMSAFSLLISLIVLIFFLYCSAVFAFTVFIFIVLLPSAFLGIIFFEKTRLDSWFTKIFDDIHLRGNITKKYTIWMLVVMFTLSMLLLLF